MFNFGQRAGDGTNPLRNARGGGISKSFIHNFKRHIEQLHDIA